MLGANDIFTSASGADWLSTLLRLCSTVGLTPSAWAPAGITSRLLAIASQALAQQDGVVSRMAQAGFLDSAALPTVTPDPAGLSSAAAASWTPGWLDILADSVYGVARLPATYAAGLMNFVNVPANASATYQPGQFHVTNPSTGQTYSNVLPFQIGPSGPTNGVPFQADLLGAAGTAGAGTITQLTTSVVGVTCTNPAAMVGQNWENNAALVARCRLRVQFLSANGAKGAYIFVARSATSAPFNAVLVGGVINRSDCFANPSTGEVTVVIANAAGAPPPADVATIAAVLQQYATPSGVTSLTAAASNHNIAVVCDVWIPTAQASAATGVVQSAVTSYFASIPIGGFPVGVPVPNSVPLPGLEGFIHQGLLAAGLSDSDLAVTLNGATNDVVLGPFEVPVATSIGVNVHPS